MMTAILEQVIAGPVAAILLSMLGAAALLWLVSGLWARHYDKAWASKKAYDARRSVDYWLRHRKLPYLRAEFNDKKAWRGFRPGWGKAPGIGAAEVARAVAEAEFDAWCRYMCQNEYSGLKSTLPQRPRLERRLALDAYRASLPDMSPGADVEKVLERRRHRTKSRSVFVPLQDLHGWLDDLLIGESGNAPDLSPARKFEAVQAAGFRCPKCGRDPSDGIQLTASRQKDGAITVTCTDCLFELDQDLMEEIRRSVEGIKESKQAPEQ